MGSGRGGSSAGFQEFWRGRTGEGSCGGFDGSGGSSATAVGAAQGLSVGGGAVSTEPATPTRSRACGGPAKSCAARSTFVFFFVFFFRVGCWGEGSSFTTCVEIKLLRRVRAESSRRPPRHRRDACLMAWRCRFLTTRRSQHGRRLTGWFPHRCHPRRKRRLHQDAHPDAQGKIGSKN